jgi:glycosyltransferase involved in cell wall biosynthesis
MIRILFNGHDFKFLQPLIAHYQRSSSYQVALDHTGGHHIFDKPKSLKLLADADIIFCEWCLGNAVWYSQNKQEGQKLIIRLHAQEMNLDFLNHICWDKVDRLVFICPENMEVFLGRFPEMGNRAILIYNLIDYGALNREKKQGSAFNLGFIGLSPQSKAPHLALELFERLKEIDDRYVLYFKGKHPWEYPWLWERSEERKYFEALYKRIRSSRHCSSIVFDPFGPDMNEWFSKIGIILSTSHHEGSHQAVAEGMAAGCLPVIRNWAGADKMYPPRFVVRNLGEAVRMIQHHMADPDFSHLQQDIRMFAWKNFDISVITARYDRMFEDLFHSNGTDEASKLHSLPTRNNPQVAILCFLTPGKHSGYEVRVMEEAGLLIRQGLHPWIVIFISAEKNPPVEALEWYIKEVTDKTGCNVKLIPTDHYFHLHESDGLIKTIDQPMLGFIQQESIEILHAEALYAGHHSLRIAGKSGCRVVFDNHGSLPEETQMRGGNQQWINRLEEVEKQLVKEADLFIMVSNGMHRFYETRYKTTIQSPQILPCCVHSHAFSLSYEKRDKIREEKGVSNRFVFLYLGTLSIWQWPTAMFGLFAHINKEFPESFLYMLIPEYDHAEAREYLERFEIHGDSYLLEEVPHDEVGQRIGLADAGFLLREPHPVNLVSSPTKFGEYLAAGVPVILTEGIGDYSEMADRMKVGLTLKVETGEIAPENFTRIGSFIRDVQQNRGQWAERCREVSRRHLDWDVFGEELITKYKQLININPKRCRTKN